MKNLTVAGLILMILVAGCKTKRTEEQEVQKLLDRQTQMQESQAEAVDRLQHIRDSLSREKQALITQREQKDRKIGQLEENRQALAGKLKEEEASAVTSEKENLQEQISGYEDSIRQLKDELSGLNSSIDSIENSIGFYEMQEGRTEQTLKSGISAIDERISGREDRKQQELQKADLLKRRIQVADKKIEAYDMERQMYVDERDNLLRINATEKELEPYREKIVQMDSTIEAEKNNRQELVSELNGIKEWVTETDSVIDALQAQIKLEYDKKTIIENFIISEQERLRMELEQIDSARKALIEEQGKISKELSNTESQIASLDKRVELIRNRKMSDILEKQATIEHTEAGLAAEEVDLLEEGTGGEGIAAATTPDSLGKEFSTLLHMSNQLDSLNDMIKEEKAEVAKTRQELAEKRARITEQRARFGRTLWIVIVAVVVVGAGLLTLFYYLGKRARTKS
jgi:chromosome segregation ATPase